MEPFTAIYTDSQRVAVAQAVVDQGWTGPQTAQAAADGALPGSTEPFDIPLATVYWLARRERRRRGHLIREALLNSESLDVTLERIMRTMLEVMRTETERLLFAYQRGEPDPQRLRWLIRCDRELRKTIPSGNGYHGLEELDHLAKRLVKAI